MDKGGDIEAQSERTKDTPLSLACSGGRQEVSSVVCMCCEYVYAWECVHESVCVCVHESVCVSEYVYAWECVCA